MKKLLIALLAVLSVGCASDNWTAFVYPYGVEDESSWEIKEGFSSLEKCREWVGTFRNVSIEFDYECGSECRADNVWGNVCKETVQ